MTVNTVGLEDYVRSVVGAEVFPSWKPEALKSQAVATVPLRGLEARPGLGRVPGLLDGRLPGLRGMDSEYAATSAAADATAGEVRESAGAAALTMFSASNGGYSVASNLPYLVAKADPYDEAGGQDPNHSWTTTVTASALTNAFGVGAVSRVRVLARDGNGEWGGRVRDALDLQARRRPPARDVRRRGRPAQRRTRAVAVADRLGDYVVSDYLRTRGGSRPTPR